MPPSNLRTLRRDEAALVQKLEEVQDTIVRLEALVTGRSPRGRRSRVKARTVRARGSASRRTKSRARR